MAWRVGDNEFALFGGEETIGDIDGDALFTLGGEAVDQQGQVQLAAAGGAKPFGILGQAGQLVLEQKLAVIEQPAKQGRFTVVHRPTGDQAQQTLVVLALQIAFDFGARRALAILRH